MGALRGMDFSNVRKDRQVHQNEAVSSRLFSLCCPRAAVIGTTRNMYACLLLQGISSPSSYL